MSNYLTEDVYEKAFRLIMENISLTEKREYYVPGYPDASQEEAKNAYYHDDDALANRDIIRQEVDRGDSRRKFNTIRTFTRMNQMGTDEYLKPSVSPFGADKLGLMRAFDSKPYPVANSDDKVMQTTDNYTGNVIGKYHKDTLGQVTSGWREVPDDPPTYAKGVKFVQPKSKEINRWTGKRKS